MYVLYYLSQDCDAVDFFLVAASESKEAIEAKKEELVQASKREHAIYCEDKVLKEAWQELQQEKVRARNMDAIREVDRQKTLSFGQLNGVDNGGSGGVVQRNSFKLFSK